MSLFAVISATAADGPVLAGPDHPAVPWDEEWGDDEVGATSDEDLELRLAVPPLPGRGGGATPTEPSGPTRRQLKSQLRDANAEVARELARFSGLDHRAVNAELNRLAGVKRVTEATVEQLKVRLEHARAWLRRV
jgi:hypothetical protein